MSIDTRAKVDLREAIARRRTFAIISHPDAGKTTLTEKLLLYSGMIRTAGMVRGRKGGRAAVSDWMGMEQERGISITASAMQFEYLDRVLNLLDTPGHQDFSEDTYRTLTAADCAIMILDAAKGVEAQTRKLFEVCRLRRIPVMTFINKLDLAAQKPLDLMAEVEEVLGVKASAFNWPIGSGREFVGVADVLSRNIHLYQREAAAGALKAGEEIIPVDSEAAVERLGEDRHAMVKDDLDLLEIAGNPFTHEGFLAMESTPVFFGSALTNFGVEQFFESFVELAPPPGPRPADTEGGEEITIDPVKHDFSAFVFKLQANMDPRHRDHMAFIRICSGLFERNMTVKHHRSGDTIRLSRPHTMVAGSRETLDRAFPGDIVGIVNPGVFQLGDTISLEGGFDFKPLPHFQPEIFAQIRPLDVGRRKAFDKGLAQLSREGAIQVLHRWKRRGVRPLVAAVGRLQFEVLKYRLETEYKVKTELTQMSYTCSAWLEGDPDTFKAPYTAELARDRYHRPIVLFQSEWDKKYAIRENPDHKLLDMA